MILQAESQPAESDSELAVQVEAIFGPSGLLSHAKNFEHRLPQQEMAVAVMANVLMVPLMIAQVMVTVVQNHG